MVGFFFLVITSIFSTIYPNIGNIYQKYCLHSCQISVWSFCFQASFSVKEDLYVLEAYYYHLELFSLDENLQKMQTNSLGAHCVGNPFPIQPAFPAGSCCMLKLSYAKYSEYSLSLFILWAMHLWSHGLKMFPPLGDPPRGTCLAALYWEHCELTVTELPKSKFSLQQH